MKKNNFYPINAGKEIVTDTWEGRKRAEYKPNVAFSRLENSVVHEPLLHHGHGFDFFIVE